jgi:putative endonuclease
MDKIHLYYIYILTTARNSVLYTGVTNDLSRRCIEHKEGVKPGFTKRYNVNKLVYYEVFESVEIAIAREKQIKGMSRDKKISLINNFNPYWDDLFHNKAILLPRQLEF